MANDSTRGFEVRTIRTGETLGCFGYGVEILDGGVRGSENTLILGRGNDQGGDPAFSAAAYLRCYPGSKLISEFDYCRLGPAQQNALDVDTVTIRIHTHRNAVFSDSHGQGMHRKRWLARGTTGVVAAGGAVKIYESNDDNGSSIVHDDYHTDSRMSDKAFLDGFVYADTTCDLWILAATESTPAVPGTYRGIIVASLILRTMPAGIANANRVTGYTYNFTFGSTGLTSTVGVPVPCPATPFEIWMLNTSAGNMQGGYMVGLRGSL